MRHVFTPLRRWVRGARSIVPVLTLALESPFPVRVGWTLDVRLQLNIGVTNPYARPRRVLRWRRKRDDGDTLAVWSRGSMPPRAEWPLVPSRSLTSGRGNADYVPSRWTDSSSLTQKVHWNPA